MMDVPSEALKQQRLIDDLKNALVQRDVRIGQLELMLMRALVSAEGALDADGERSLFPAPPPPVSHPLSSLILAETKGLYADGWTGPTACIVLHPGADSGHYQISFWIPVDVEAKPLVLNRGSTDEVWLEMQPGRSVTHAVAAPPDGLSPVILQIETNKIEPKGEDRRELGVVVSRVVWVDGGHDG